MNIQKYGKKKSIIQMKSSSVFSFNQKSEIIASPSFSPDQSRAIKELRNEGASIQLDQNDNAVRIAWGVHSSVTDKGLEYLAELDTLQEAVLTQMTNTRLSYISMITNLRRLSFDPSITASDITDEGLQHLIPLIKLETLNLGAAKISDDGLHYLAHLKNMRLLELGWRNTVSVQGLSQLTNLSNLQYLGDVDSLSPEYVKYFPKLETIFLYETEESDLKYLQGLSNLRD